MFGNENAYDLSISNYDTSVFDYAITITSEANLIRIFHP
jgi:hypothetical protein